MKVVVQLVAAALLLLAERKFVSPSPLSTQDDSRRLGLYAGSGLTNKDEDVKDLERLKPVGSFSVLKSHSKIYTNINGKEKEMAQTKEEVNVSNTTAIDELVRKINKYQSVDKDGSLLAKMEQTVNKAGDGVDPRITTSLDIPSHNIHKVLHNRPNAQKIDMESRGQPGVQYSPADMADYIFWTGDERGVTSAIEEYLQEGMMSRSDAIEFLQEIKKNVDLMQSQFSERADMAKNKYDERALEEKYEGRTLQDKYDGRSLQDKYDGRTLYIKKSFQDSLGGSNAGALNMGNLGGMGSLGGMGNTGPNMVANMMPAEDDYEDFIEKLKMSDYLFNEYSLEEVIYQLAKVMFTQSLSRGSIEAQDALQKVTGFLDFEAQQGKITRAMEKKILSVLISALSDTLTEHPELVNTARDSLGIPQPEPLVHRLFPQGQFKNEEREENVQRPRKSTSGQNMKRTIQDSGLKDDDKKH